MANWINSIFSSVELFSLRYICCYFVYYHFFPVRPTLLHAKLAWRQSPIPRGDVSMTYSIFIVHSRIDFAVTVVVLSVASIDLVFGPARNIFRHLRYVTCVFVSFTFDWRYSSCIIEVDCIFGGGEPAIGQSPLEISLQLNLQSNTFKTFKTNVLHYDLQLVIRYSSWRKHEQEFVPIW